MKKTLFAAVILFGMMITANCAEPKQANQGKPKEQAKKEIKSLPFISMTVTCSKCNSDKKSSVQIKYRQEYKPTGIEGAITSKTVTRRNIALKSKCSCGWSKAVAKINYGLNGTE